MLTCLQNSCVLSVAVFGSRSCILKHHHHPEQLLGIYLTIDSLLRTRCCGMNYAHKGATAFLPSCAVRLVTARGRFAYSVSEVQVQTPSAPSPKPQTEVERGLSLSGKCSRFSSSSVQVRTAVTLINRRDKCISIAIINVSDDPSGLGYNVLLRSNGTCTVCTPHILQCFECCGS